MRKVIGIAAVGLVTLGFVAYRISRPDARSESQGSAPVAQTAAAIVPAPSSMTLAERAARTYDVQLVSKVAMGPDAGNQEIEIKLSGALQWAVVSASPATLHVKAVPTELAMIQGGQQVPAEALANAHAALTLGLFVDLAADGTVKATRAAPGADDFGIQLLRQIVTLAQVALPQDAHATTWKADERDSTGVYSATYSRTSAEAGLGFKKEKTGYTKLDASVAQSDVAVGVLGKMNGSATLAIDEKSGWLVAYKGEEFAEVFLGANPTPYTKATTTLTLLFTAAETLATAPVVPASVASATSTAAVTPVSSPERDAQIAAGQLGNATLDDVKRQHRDALNAPADKKAAAAHDAFIKTKAYVVLNQKNLGELKASLKGLGSGDAWLHTTLNALSFVGCDECQALVVEEVRARLDDQTAVASTIHFLSDSLLPNEASEKLLRELTQSSNGQIRHAAELSLGSVAHRLAGAEPERADRIVKESVQRLKAAANEDERRVALAVLANTGSPVVAGAVKDLLADPSEDVRIQAVQSLTLARDAAAADALLAMAKDNSSKVRQAALQSMTLHLQADNARAGALVALLKQEQEPLLRAQLVNLLQLSYRTVPEAKQAIGDVAEGDPHPDVRSAAKSIVLMYEPQ